MVMGADDVGAVVLDCGSWTLRAGNAGEDSPRVVIPSAVGVKGVKVGESTERGELVGGSSVYNAPLSYTDVAPVYAHDEKSGTAVVKDWDGMTAIWKNVMTQLRADVSQTPLMIVEPTRSWSQKHRARALEASFEGLGTPAAYIARGAVMTAFAYARTTACVVDVGHQGATAVPVVEGFALQKATQTTNIGGHHISGVTAKWADTRLKGNENEDVTMTDATAAEETYTSRLRAVHEVRATKETEAKLQNLTEGHRLFHRMRIVHELKASLLRVEPGVPGKDLDGDEGTGVLPLTTAVKEALKRPTQYELPDGQTINLEDGGGLSIASDALFTKEEGVAKLAYEGVTASDVDCRRELYGGVIFTGGCSLIPGAMERFSRELSILTPQQYKLKVHAASAAVERTCGPWIGGSIVASLGTFQSSWISKDEYEEVGSSVALRRCP